jgi:hypothetical protein
MRSLFRRAPVALVAALAINVAVASSASAHQWLVNGTEASGQGVAVSGSTSTLRWGNSTITCTTTSGKGTVKAGGAGEFTEIKFTGCTATTVSCYVKSVGQANGTIVTTSLPTVLTEREPSGGGQKKLSNEFKENASHEIFGLEFVGNCTEWPNGTVRGEVASTVKTLTGGNIELAFPSPELKGNTLTYFGAAFHITTKLTMSLEKGGTLTAL